VKTIYADEIIETVGITEEVNEEQAIQEEVFSPIKLIFIYLVSYCSSHV
jgi:hypothetical protein